MAFSFGSFFSGLGGGRASSVAQASGRLSPSTLPSTLSMQTPQFLANGGRQALMGGSGDILSGLGNIFGGQQQISPLGAAQIDSSIPQLQRNQLSLNQQDFSPSTVSISPARANLAGSVSGGNQVSGSNQQDSFPQNLFEFRGDTTQSKIGNFLSDAGGILNPRVGQLNLRREQLQQGQQNQAQAKQFQLGRLLLSTGVNQGNQELIDKGAQTLGIPTFPVGQTPLNLKTNAGDFINDEGLIKHKFGAGSPEHKAFLDRSKPSKIKTTNLGKLQDRRTSLEKSLETATGKNRQRIQKNISEINSRIGKLNEGTSSKPTQTDRDRNRLLDLEDISKSRPLTQKEQREKLLIEQSQKGDGFEIVTNPDGTITVRQGSALTTGSKADSEKRLARNEVFINSAELAAKSLESSKEAIKAVGIIPEFKQSARGLLEQLKGILPDEVAKSIEAVVGDSGEVKEVDVSRFLAAKALSDLAKTLSGARGGVSKANIKQAEDLIGVGLSANPKVIAFRMKALASLKRNENDVLRSQSGLSKPQNQQSSVFVDPDSGRKFIDVNGRMLELK